MSERIITQDGGHILLWLRGGRLLVLLRRLCFEAEFGERLFQQLGCQLSFTRALFACVFWCSAGCSAR